MNRVSRYLRPLVIVDERLPWLFPVVGTVALSLIGNLIYDFAKTTGGFFGGLLAISFLFTTGILGVLLYTLRLSRQKVGVNIAVEDKKNPPKRDGLIIMLSNESVAVKAIEHHRPQLKHCWMIVTPKMQSLADSLRRKYADTGLQLHQQDLVNEYDTDGGLRIVRGVFAHEAPPVGVLPQGMIADITGGTKPMTAAMVAACRAGNYAMQHVPTLFIDGKPSGALDPIEIEFS